MAIGANLSKRDQILISAAVLSVALAGAYAYFLYLPKRDRLAASEEHADVLEGRNAKVSAEVTAGSLAKMRAEALQFAAELAVLRQVVPTTNELSALLHDVSTA